MATPGAKREAVAHAREHHGVSEPEKRLGGGACALVGVSRRVIRCEPTRPDDGALRQGLRELATRKVMQAVSPVGAHGARLRKRCVQSKCQAARRR